MSAVVKDFFLYDFANCPCNTPPGETQKIQPFVGNDYFCESGNPNTYWTYKLYTDDPLWDGKELNVVLKRQVAAQLLIFHGFIKHLFPALTILNLGSVEMNQMLMRMFQSAFLICLKRQSNHPDSFTK